jgi:AraC-like DNA-binding protein
VLIWFGMALYDPAIARLFQILGSASGQVTSVQRWGAADDSPLGDHLHAIPILYLCLVGTVRVLGGRAGRVDLLAGQALAIAPGVRHAHQPLRAGCVALDLGFIADACDFEILEPGRCVWGRMRAEPYRAWCTALVDARAQERVGLVRQMLAAIATERIDAMGFPHPAQRAMAQRLWCNERGLDAGRILAASGLGQRRSHALFREFFHQTPKQALLDQRLSLAQTYLGDGLPVAAAAERAGFRDRADLTRAWRRRYGAPPTG